VVREVLDMPIMNEDIIELIKPILGNDAILSERIESNNNSVFIAKTMVNEYIIKLYKYRNWPEIDKVPYVNQLLQNNKIQCASLIAYEREGSKFENGYIIEERVKGVPVLSKDGIPLFPKDQYTEEFEAYIYDLLAKLIAKVHNITFKKFGNINGGHPIYNTFHEFMEETIMLCNTDGLIENQVFTKSEITELVHRLCEKFKEYDNLKPVLCHGDLSMRNVIYNKDSITLIDWDDSVVLPWMADVAYLTYPFVCSKVKQMENRKSFLDSYETEYDKDRFNSFEKLYHTFLSIKYLDWQYKYNQGKGSDRIKTNLNELLKDIGLNFQMLS
jgi:thiamine kinase-like enzyme